MATTAVLSVDETSLSANQPARFTVVVANSGGSAAVKVASISPVLSPVTAPATVPAPVFPPQATVQIAGGESLSIPFGGVAYAAKRPADASSEQLAVGVRVVVAFTDGSQILSNTVTLQVTPAATPTIPMPFPRGASLRFDSNNDAVHAFTTLPL